MSENSYTTRELWVQNGSLRIYGVAYVPETDGTSPLVIFSHELGNDHSSGERYAERLAQAGYAAYVFDFCGGTVGGNKSDGSNKEMSVLTEASDLEAVLRAAKTWDFVDPDRIVLLGGSMGGLVTTVVGCTHQDEIAGMILMYPALSAKVDSGMERYGTKEEVPEDVSLFGGWIHVGRNYITDLWDVDFNQLLASYQGHMLLLHGDRDSTVPISWSQEVKEIIPDCEFHVIENGGHEFFHQPFEDAMTYILAYLETQLKPGQKEDTEAETMRLKINETHVEVIWEENDSVSALRELCQNGPLTIQMAPYGGFEQVGPIGQSLPRNDAQTITEPGDIVLYSGNQIVVFYGSNSWAYTRLGKIQGMDQAALTALLGNGAVTLTLSLGAETAEHRIPDVLLNSGYTMPVIGLGTWTLNDEEAENSVYHALKCGMRLIDTARYYGNEVGVGRGLQRAIDEGIVTREEVFLTSKIYGGNYERAGGIIDNALSDLNVDYIDLLLIHQPGADDEGVYKAMEEAVKAGKLRSIGISNYYTPEAVDEVLSFAEIVPAVIQNENHLYYQNAALQEYVKQYGIVVESWYPFGGRGHTQDHFSNEVILELAQKYGKSPAQIILRWHVQAGYVTIPGSSNPDHIAENYDIFSFCLTEQEMQRLFALDRQERYENW